jgi:tRNA(Ile)-lysidine synthase
MPRDLKLDVESLFGLVVGYERLGLAVSGGPDSLALMVLAARWAKPRSVELFVYSVDHGLRPEARDEAAMVKREAEALGLAARLLRWEGKKPETGVQEAARYARYRLIGDAMRGDGVDVLLTAHHMDDQAETVLMRMAHGSGIGGIGGMLPFAMTEYGFAVARPLLGVPKADLEAVVRAAGLTPAHDPSNDSDDYERVRWRRMMPALAEMGLDARRLAKLASRAADASQAIESAADSLIAKYTDEPLVDFELPVEAMTHVPPAVGVRVVGRALELIGKARKSRDLSPIESLFERLSSGGALKPTTLHGCLIESDGRTISIRREPPRKSARKVQEKATSH